MASALRLPELLTLIGTYLDPPNLLRCVQVSLFWNMAFIPVLWRTIDDTSYSWPRVIKDISSGSFMEQAKKEERLRNIYGKYGAHIRDFRSSGYIPIVIAQASGSFVNLHTLAVKSIEKVMFQEARRLRGILRQCGDSTEDVPSDSVNSQFREFQVAGSSFVTRSSSKSRATMGQGFHPASEYCGTEPE
ncbi:hypothetical protein EC991_010239 [Linnemannia zychae]|nr:hypothetical protein EC991_010239 [Linnemannia zychae]